MRKMRIFCDRTLLSAMMVFAVVSSIVTIGTMFGVVHEGSVASPSDVVLIRTMFGVLLLGLWLALVASSPRYFCTLTLSDTAISVWIPFNKRETFSYTQFRFVYCGKYFHGNAAGMGKDIWYIVIAQRQLTANELNAINGVPYAALESVGVRRLSPHCCRHTYVSLAQSVSIPMEVIRALVGHSDTHMTEHYLHVLENAKITEVNKLNVFCE